jgi:hypothetical protein
MSSSKTFQLWLLKFFIQQWKKNPEITMNRYQIKYITSDKKIFNATPAIYPNHIVVVDKNYPRCPKCNNELISEIIGKKRFLYSCLGCDYAKPFDGYNER